MLDHALSIGEVARLVWKKTTSDLGLQNFKMEPWRVKINRWFIDARLSNFLGKIQGLIPILIT